MVASNAAPMLPDGTPYVPATNYYNPFGIDITLGGRRLVELGPRGFAQRVDTWRALAGVRGEVGGWHWEVFGRQHRTPMPLTRESGTAIAGRVAAGVDASGPDSTGRIVCGLPDPLTGIVPTNAVIDDCVPINLFGGAGTITQDQVDFMSGPRRDNGHNSQRLANAQIAGPWGRLPGGTFSGSLARISP